MRHGKDTVKIGRTSAHRDSMFVNMLKSLIEHGRISTTIVKAKELRRRIDPLITLAKQNDLAARRKAIATLRISFNELSASELKAAKAGDKSSYSTDRKVIGKLFDELGPRFATRPGGFTRIIRTYDRVGDNAPVCLIQFVE